MSTKRQDDMGTESQRQQENNYQQDNGDDTSKKDGRESKDDKDTEFYFFYDIVKKSLLKRKEVGDICALSSWLRALEEHTDKEIRLDYIKLMVLSLQYMESICPFKDPPPDTIDPLEDGVVETMKTYLLREGDALCEELEPEDQNTSISTAVSSDKCQYASYQVIPNVGVQCYYAYSDDAMYHWSLPPEINVPKDGPHAMDIEWERSFAGIVAESVPASSTENLESENTNKSASASNVTKKKTDKKNGEDEEICNVMYIEQQNRNVTEEFTWNDASLLTGAMILGAEMCSDRKVDAQIKTQIEIDEEIGYAHDKLYPGDFKICVNPIVIGDIVTPKKYLDMEGCNKNISCKQKESFCDTQASCPTKDKQPTLSSSLPTSPPMPPPPPESAPVKTPCSENISTYGSTRQSAGHGNIRLPEDLRTSMMGKKDAQRQKIHEIGNSKYFRSRKHAESKYPVAMEIESSTETILDCKKPISKQDRSKEINLLFERASLELQRRVNTTNECFVGARSLMRDNHKEPKKFGQNTRTYCDSDEPSDV